MAICALLTLLTATLPLHATAIAATAPQTIDPQRIGALDIPRQWIELVHEQVSLYDIDLPQTTRVYAYLSIALHEAVLEQSTDEPSLRARLNEMPAMPSRDRRQSYNAPAIAIGALSTVADALLTQAAPSQSQRAVRQAVASLRGTQTRLWLQRGTVERGVLELSRAYGDEIGAAMVEWAASDGYAELTTRPFSIPTGGDYFWQPTPRDAAPVQPFWGFLRPLALDATEQCDVPLRLEFSTTPGTTFHRQAMEAHDYAEHLTTEQAQIVAFWQADPTLTRSEGYRLLEGNAATRWMLIASRATVQLDLSLAEAANVYADLGIALGDVGTSVWRAKYENFLLRPETYIHRYIDERWTPLLPTPHSPDYPAAEPAVAAAAAEVLTAHLGIVNFRDSFGIIDGKNQPRPFTTFEGAAYEHAMSSLYAGQSLRVAVEAGMRHGECVARVAMGRS